MRMLVSGIFQLQAHRNREQARSYSFAAGANLVCGGCKSGDLATTVGAGLLANRPGQQPKCE